MAANQLDFFLYGPKFLYNDVTDKVIEKMITLSYCMLSG